MVGVEVVRSPLPVARPRPVVGMAVVRAAVLPATAGVWAFGAGWPDLPVAVALLVLFMRSAWRVLAAAWAGLREAPPAG